MSNTGDRVASPVPGADYAVVILTAAMWPLGALAMFFTKSWTLVTKAAAIGLLLVVGLIFSLAPRLGGGVAAAAVTAFLLSRHPEPTRSLKVAGWVTTAVVAVLCLVGLLLPPFIRVGWH